MELIQHVAVPAGGVSILTVNNIPQIYDDLLVTFSMRTNRDAHLDVLKVSFNGAVNNWTSQQLIGFGNGSGGYAERVNGSHLFSYTLAGATATANTFANGNIYIPNYRAAIAKSVASDGVIANSASNGWSMFTAGLWNQTAPVTSISFDREFGGLFVQHSSVSVYGIRRNAIAGITVS